jgi:hypothetical protein
VKDHRRAGLPSPYPAAIPRRILTITVVWTMAALGLALSPVLVLSAVAIDLATRRRGWPTVRLLGLFGAFLWIEVTSQFRVLWVWVSQPFARKSWTLRNHEGEHWWLGRLYRAGRRIIGLDLRVEGPDDVGPGPLLVFAQHVSIVDAVVPGIVLAVDRGRYVRYVLTRGLRFDPCMDIVGHRIPNHFVARGVSDNAEELATLRLLAAGMEQDEGAIIFPGGALHTVAQRERAVEKLTERGSPQAAAATTFRHVLPPRPGGVQAFFAGAPDAAVLVIGHVGFEPLASLKRLRGVLPLREPIELRIWRHERSEVPTDPEERLAWVYERWAVMDDWIEERMLARAGSATMAPA